MDLKDIKDAVLIWGPVSKEGLEALKKEDSLVVVAEMRPFILGLKYNIPLFKKAGIKCVYCTDNMIGALFYEGRIRKTFVFYEQEKEDSFLCMQGALYVALLSKLHDVEVIFLHQEDLILDFTDRDASTFSGRGFLVEREDAQAVEKELLYKEKIA